MEPCKRTHLPFGHQRNTENNSCRPPHHVHKTPHVLGQILNASCSYILGWREYSQCTLNNDGNVFTDFIIFHMFIFLVITIFT
jgi:hypothetical protein